MGKKLFIATSVALTLITTFVLLTPAAHATLNVYFDHTYDYVFVRNDFPRDVSPILIIDNNGQSIKATHGLRFIIPDGLYVLWDKSVTSVGATGSAVTANKIASSLNPVYSDNLKEVFLPVRADFATGEQASIEGFKMRVYNRGNDRRFIGLDVNGDRVSDITNLRSISVSGTDIRTDGTAPFSVTNFAGSYANSRVTLTWRDPPDYDLERLIFERALTRAGRQIVNEFELYPGDTRFEDQDVREGEAITYTLKARDTLNLSDPVAITVQIQTSISVGSSTLIGSSTAPTGTSSPVGTSSSNTIIQEQQIIISETSERFDFSDIDRLSVSAQNDIRVMTGLMLYDKKTFERPSDGRLLPSRQLDGFWALKIALALTPTGCGSQVRYPGFTQCLEQAQNQGLVSQRFRPRLKMKRLAYYELLLRAANIPLQNASPADLTRECGTSNPTLQMAKVYFTAKNLGIISLYRDTCKLNSRLSRASAMQYAARAYSGAAARTN